MATALRAAPAPRSAPARAPPPAPSTSGVARGDTTRAAGVRPSATIVTCRESFAQAGRQPDDRQRVEQPAHALRKHPVPDGAEPQAQRNSRLRRLRGSGVAQHDRPTEVRGPAGRAVNEHLGRFEDRDLERRVAPTPIRNDVADRKSRELGIKSPQRSSRARDDALDGARQIPAGAPLAELHEPRPHVGGASLERERAIHDDGRAGYELVAWELAGDLLRRRPDPGERTAQAHRQSVGRRNRSRRRALPRRRRRQPAAGRRGAPLCRTKCPTIDISAAGTADPPQR